MNWNAQKNFQKVTIKRQVCNSIRADIVDWEKEKNYRRYRANILKRTFTLNSIWSLDSTYMTIATEAIPIEPDFPLFFQFFPGFNSPQWLRLSTGVDFKYHLTSTHQQNNQPAGIVPPPTLLLYLFFTNLYRKKDIKIMVNEWQKH